MVSSQEVEDGHGPIIASMLIDDHNYGKRVDPRGRRGWGEWGEV